MYAEKLEWYSFFYLCVLPVFLTSVCYLSFLPVYVTIVTTADMQLAWFYQPSNSRKSTLLLIYQTMLLGVVEKSAY